MDVKLSSSSNPKIFWKSVKGILSSKSSFMIPPLSHNGDFINNDNEKVELFNNYFAEQCKLSVGSVNHSLPVFVSLTDHQLDIPQFSPQQILDILNQLQSNKATGPDGIGNFILQATAVSISNPLCKLFNYCLTKQTFPEIWKLAYVTPVHKKNEKMFCQNYRPISLLNNISKIFERAVYNTLYDYLISNNLLNPKNAGFKKGDSTTNQLLYITDKIYKAVDEGKDIHMVFLDAAKAFGTRVCCLKITTTWHLTKFF